MRKLIHEELSRSIIGAAMEVLNDLKPGDAHIAQMIGYLNITKLQLAILLNFKNATLSWKRVVREPASETPEPPDLRA
ncbi:MAG: GxxExxY protein [Spartobacteria bacterium]